MALAIGTADDVRPLPPLVRLAAELLTAVVLALIVTTRFTGIVSILLVVLATVVLVNGFNLIDGLDGLCGSVSLASAVGFAVVLGRPRPISGRGAGRRRCSLPGLQPPPGQDLPR